MIDFRAIVAAAILLQGRGPRWLAERVHDRWITSRSPHGVKVDSAEESIAHWLGGSRPIPIAALEAILDVLGFEVRKID